MINDIIGDSFAKYCEETRQHIANAFSLPRDVLFGCRMIPTVTEETEENIDWAKMWGIPVAPAPAPKPVEKPLPTFHNRPRVYDKNLKDWEEQ